MPCNTSRTDNSMSGINTKNPDSLISRGRDFYVNVFKAVVLPEDSVDPDEGYGDNDRPDIEALLLCRTLCRRGQLAVLVLVPLSFWKR